MAKMCAGCEEMKLTHGKYVCMANNEKEIVATDSTEVVLRKLYQKPVWCPK